MVERGDNLDGLEEVLGLNSLPQLLTAEEVAGVMRVSKDLIYSMARDGEIPHVKLGRLVRIPKHQLIDWIETGEKGA